MFDYTPYPIFTHTTGMTHFQFSTTDTVSYPRRQIFKPFNPHWTKKWNGYFQRNSRIVWGISGIYRCILNTVSRPSPASWHLWCNQIAVTHWSVPSWENSVFQHRYLLCTELNMGTTRLVAEPNAVKDNSVTVILVSTFLGLTSHSCLQAHIKVKRVYRVED